MKQIMALIACLSFTACAAPMATTPDEPMVQTIDIVQVKGPVATTQEHTACEKAGGMISRRGMLGREMCVIPYPDAGKVCTDSDQCQGQCRADSSLDTQEAMAASSGTCQINTSPFGCFATIEDGKGTPTLCVD